jgi:hypothetical protein
LKYHKLFIEMVPLCLVDVSCCLFAFHSCVIYLEYIDKV